MRANARKRVSKHAFFNTRLRKNGACVFACALAAYLWPVLYMYVLTGIW